MRRYIYAIVGLMLVLYLFPWVVNPGVSLSPNGYDLAEWASLNPAVRKATPALLTSLLLRLPLACFALLIAFTTKRGLIPVLIVLTTAAALLPPPEFIKQVDDPNFRQQAGLALFTFVGGFIGLSGRLPRSSRWVAAIVGLIGALASVVGLLQSYNLMQGFNLPTQIGAGGVLLAFMFVLVAGGELTNQTG